MKKTIGIILCLALFMYGCIPSLHPLYTKKDLVLMPELVGHWVNPEDDETWIFEKYSEKFTNELIMPAAVPDRERAYLLTIRSKEPEREFIIHVVKLGKNNYIDFYPVNYCESDGSFYNLHFIAAHSFARVETDGSSLTLGMMDNDELEKAIRENRVRIKHEKTHDGILLTASTEDLQRFVSKYGDLEGSFDSMTKFERITENEE